ncbi:MAG: hypothetical protein F4Z02_01390 [Acidimicrobiia bacterium]|nr:hypothetical protein [Acidimicrobiia bacterium]
MRVEPRWITVAAYYYVDVPQYEDVVTKKFVGYKKTRIPPYTKSVEVFNYENQPVYESQPIYEQVPVYKTVTKYETQYRCPADHNLKNGKCVHPKTTKPDPTPIAVSCSAGQYAPPLPDGQNGREPVWIHITTQKVIDHATYQQVGLTSRSLYEQPAWEKVGTAPECYTPKLKEATKVNVVELIIDGITYVIESGKAVIKAASDLAGKAKDAVEKASRTYAENLYRTARLAFDAFCSAPGQVLSGAVAGYALAQTTIAASATAALAASSVTVVAAGATAIVAVSAAAIAGTAIWLGCKYVIDNIVPDTDDDSDTDDSDTDDSDTDDSDTDTDDTDDTDTESRAEKEARVAALRAQWMAMLPNAVKDEQKCAGICWDDPANAELLRVYQAWLALLKELYG